jgi:CubicO group peptidase (beta-lactamase class C family)
MKANVLDPLGMRSSAYVWSAEMQPHIARPHDGDSKPLTSGRTTPTDAARYAAMGGLRTSALDYANFLVEVIAPHAPERFRLSAARRDEMLRPHLRVDDTISRALGWELRRTPAGTLIQHAGGQAGVHAFAAASIEKRSGYAIFTNGAHGWKVFNDARFTTLMDRILLM